jgi:hypothetical protein
MLGVMLFLILCAVLIGARLALLITRMMALVR